MAEVASAAAAITTTVLKLSEILSKEGNLLFGVSDGVERLSRELEWMQSFLKDAEHKLENSNVIRTWVSNVRDLAYDAEDTIDTFLLKLVPDTSSSWQCFAFSKNIGTAHRLGRQLQILTAKANDISTCQKRYGLVSSDGNNMRRSEETLKEIRETNSYGDNEFMVGFDREASTLKNELTSGGSKLSVISVLGMGGLGKTTLAKKVYTELKDGYPCHAWVCVSQEFKIEEIFQQLIMSVTSAALKELQGMSSRDLSEMLRRGLTGTNFLVVLDDVWTTEAWQRIKSVFPNEEIHSRIIVTTRIEEVAKVTNGFILRQGTLDENDSWALFCRRTFPEDADLSVPLMSRKYGKELIDLGEKMVAKCSGLPLAIVTLGALLSTKSQSVDEWQTVKDNLWKELGKEAIQINAILSLSFKYLPDHLKLCLLYVGMFPEDSEIHVPSLMWMWEAEGFIKHADEEGNIERIAKSYFNELVGRSLLQEVCGTVDWIDGSFCRVHDLVRDLVIEKAKEVSYSAFYGKSKKFDFRKTPPHRRLALINNDIRSITSDYTNSSLRTLFFELGDSYDSMFQSSVNKLFKSLHLRFPLLRVLDIHFLRSMPDLQLGKLVNLRYLSLTSYHSIELPKTLGDLRSLQTLAVWTYNATKLPKTLVKLQNLKYLGGNFMNGGRLIGDLEGLLTLEIVDLENWLKLDTAKLGNLRHLVLGNHSRTVGSTNLVLQKFKGLKRLQKLKWNMETPCEISEIFKQCGDITHVMLQNICINLVFNDFASNLEVLQISKVEDEDFSDLMSSLEKLPKLRALAFGFHTKQHLKYTCSHGGFSQLKTLIIKFDVSDEHDGYITLVGTMRSLTNLSVSPLGKLKRTETPEQSTTTTETPSYPSYFQPDRSHYEAVLGGITADLPESALAVQTGLFKSGESAHQMNSVNAPNQQGIASRRIRFQIPNAAEVLGKTIKKEDQTEVESSLSEVAIATEQIRRTTEPEFNNSALAQSEGKMKNFDIIQEQTGCSLRSRVKPGSQGHTVEPSKASESARAMEAKKVPGSQKAMAAILILLIMINLIVVVGVGIWHNSQ